ncbi:MAG: tRNA preQ1(34) S-adenosylmethionine ribosyltransferase-isomerase QueA [Treponema sp.]|nr:MAG: tRNA preQ1(34) S-adenosylmethionine ribosyltransferase-isomerase QueA [Treponema sp.]
MHTDDFDFDLPENLIAQEPAKTRGQDRLLVLDARSGNYFDRQFSDLVDLIPENALMVFNNSRVRKARVFAANKKTGGQAEFLFLHPYEAGRVWQVMAKRNKRQKAGNRYLFEDGMEAELVLHNTIDFDNCTQNTPALNEDLTQAKFLRFAKPLSDDWFDINGHIPLPPYIRRADCPEDADRYQTVFAEKTGSVAAPTAGLHFTKDILSKLDAKGIKRAEITLHVGRGTFLPVRTGNLEDHKMHIENFFISDETAALVENQKQTGNPIIAVGTTSVRALETAYQNAGLQKGWQSSDIFIYPGYKFKIVNHLLTNFHTPKSTLLMLVSALAGRENILKAYNHAVQKEYRFFSYGDAMLIM